MAGEDISESVLRFLGDYINSIEQLWVLLLLHSEPDRVWTTAEVTMELRSADTSITKRLDDLYARKVLLRLPELEGKHKFTPSTDEIRTVVGELARENQKRPYRIIEAVYAHPHRALRDLADAFKFRGDKS